MTAIAKIPSSVALGQVLREARKAVSMTQEEIAGLLELSRPTIVAIEQGARQVRAGELAGFARYYGVEAGELLERAGNIQIKETINELLYCKSVAQKRVLIRLLDSEPTLSTMRTARLMAESMTKTGVEDLVAALLSLLIEGEQTSEEGTEDYE